MEDKLAKAVIDRFEKLKTRRVNWEWHWQQVAEYNRPNKDSITRTHVPGEKKGERVYDSTGPHSAELLAGHLHGMLTSPTSQWFELYTGIKALDEDDVNRKWMQDAAKKLHDIFNNSNFQTEIHEDYMDSVDFGTSCLMIEPDEKDVIRFSTRPIQENYIDENHLHEVDTNIREYKWTGRRILSKFEEQIKANEFPEKALKMIKDKPDEMYEMLHNVSPRELANPEILNPKNFPFASIYVLKEKGITLHEGGFREFPFAISRWSKLSGEVYGRSPAMTALPDIKMINAMMKATIQGAQNTVFPPFEAPDDGYIGPIRLNPGKVNFYRSGTPANDRLKALTTNSRIDFGFELINMIQKKIENAFFVDELKLKDGPQMTALEVAQRTEQSLRLLGPMLGRQEKEKAKTIVNRSFAIAYRKGLLGEAPKALRGRELKVRYSSMIAKAQRVNELQNVDRWFASLAPLAESRPEILDNVNHDEAARFYARGYGVPEDLITDVDDREEIRQSRADAQEELIAEQKAAQAAQNAEKLAGTAEKVSQAGAA